MLDFLANTQLPTGELPYIVDGPYEKGRIHYLCYQYNAFQFLKLAWAAALRSDPRTHRILSALAGFLAKGVTKTGASAADCFHAKPETDYFTAVLAAALREARASRPTAAIDANHRQAAIGSAELSERCYARLLQRQRPDGSFAYTTGDYGFLRDGRSYPRPQVMTLFHLLYPACGNGFERTVDECRVDGLSVALNRPVGNRTGTRLATALMCGICGVFNFGTGEPADPVALKRATDAMAHRGPDDEGFHLDGALGLGNRRLSIIDLPGGHQPIANEDESVWITFNGEIYNYRDLRPDLLARGHQFRTNSDTETILHLYEEYDLSFLDHLRGMFAFAIWDSRKRRLLLARDRLGVKPLFYRLDPGRLAFASELRTLRELLPRPPEIDPQSIYDFFGFRYIPAPRTFYRGVEKLLPGHFLVADPRGVRSHAYWDIPPEEETAKPPKEIAAEIVEQLRESVRLRLIADVPLGVFLSGGTDSSAVVALHGRARRAPAAHLFGGV